MRSSKGHRSKGNYPAPPPTSQQNQFPGEWSEWVWNSTYKRNYRYRQIAATGDNLNDYEYDYQDSAAPRSADPEAILADAISAEAPEPTEAHAQDSRYTTEPSNEPVETLTTALRQTNLSPISETQKQVAAPQYNINYSSGRERSNSLSGGPSSQRPRGGGGFSAGRYVRTEDPSTDTEPLDPNFRVFPSYAFTFGKVFKVLWSEPTGSTGTEITGYQKAKYGEKSYHSIRRFLIVDERHGGHSICLPILTYGGRGTTKKGVHGSTHAIIFTGKGPVSKKGERLNKSAIRMIPDTPQHHLDPASRINYAKVYTVEHNVKVQFIGRIKGKYEQQVTIDYNDIHRPLPDRYFEAENSENDVAHAQGSDPQILNQRTSPAPTTSWSPQSTSQSREPGAGVSSAPMNTLYGAVKTSSWATNSNIQSSSSYIAPGSYTQPTTWQGSYAPSYIPSPNYGTHPGTTRSTSESYSNVLPYSPESEVNDPVATVEQTTAVEAVAEQPIEEATVADDPNPDDNLYDASD